MFRWQRPDPGLCQRNMNQAPASFLHNIPSIHQKNPATIPPVLGNLDLNRHIAAGDPLDYQHVTNANALATALKGQRGGLELSWTCDWYSYVFVDCGDPQVTQQMVNIAASRAVAVETACKFHISTCIIGSLHSL